MTESKQGRVTLASSEIGDSVCFERVLPGSIPEVWKYLTDPKRITRWLAGGTIELRLGGAVNLDFDLIQCPGRENMHGRVSGVVTELEPPTRLAYSWNEDGSAPDPSVHSVVTFQLSPVSRGETKLVLTHTRIRRRELTGIAAGWHAHLDVLGMRLQNAEPKHFEAAWTLLEQGYRERL